MATRPDTVPEQFWDSVSGSVKGEDLASAYSDAQTQLDVISASRAEIPDAPEGYEFVLPEGTELPEGYEFDASKHPDSEALREIAHRHGVHPTAVSEIMALAVKSEIETHTAHAQAMSALGKDAAGRIAITSAAVNAKLGADGSQLAAVMQAAPEIVPLIEKLIAGNGSAAPKPQDAPVTDSFANYSASDRALMNMMEGKKS